jgi:PAS domain S-box-containing protein
MGTIMDRRLRNSGVNIIGDISWGTHIGQLYSSKEDFFQTGVTYIQSGLINNELCIWIYSDNTTYEEIKEKLSEYVDDVDSYLQRGQLKIIHYSQWYIKDNSFNEVRINKQWTDLVKQAVDSGCDGLRAIADTAWLEKSFYRTFLHYERSVNRYISELPFIVICLYDANKVDAFAIAEIIKNHSYVITKDEDKLGLIRNVEILIKDRQIERSEERYRKLLELLPDAVFIHDEKTIFYCNESAVQMIGVKNSYKLLGRSMAILVIPEMEINLQRFINNVLKGNKEFNFLISKFNCGNGEVKDVEIVATKYIFQGRHVVLSVVRDITHLMEIDELKKDIAKKRQLLEYSMESDKMKTEFFSNISHELKTPLNVILAAIQLMKLSDNKPCCDKYRNKYLKMMQQNCFRLLRIVNNIIDITKIDANYYEIKSQNYDIVKLIREITQSVAEYAVSKSIIIMFESDLNEKTIACDPDAIERIILNLLSNAIKFTPMGGNIWVKVNENNEKLTISVKDNGIGIPLHKQKTIFDRFQQVDKSLTRQSEGSGIGLSLVKALVEKHDGEITLNSQLNQGSEFIIELPCKVLLDEQNKSEPSANSCTNSHVEKINIEFSDIYS